MMLCRRRRATLRIYASAARKGVRVPKMLTVDERFEAIITGVAPQAKLRPVQEPEPRESTPKEEEAKPLEREEK